MTGTHCIFAARSVPDGTGPNTGVKPESNFANTVVKRETLIGRTYEACLFFDSGDTTNTGYLDTCVAGGRIPIIKWADGQDVTSINNGTHDTNLHTWAVKLRAFPKFNGTGPIFVYNQEFNASVTAGMAPDFVRAFRRIYWIMNGTTAQIATYNALGTTTTPISVAAANNGAGTDTMVEMGWCPMRQPATDITYAESWPGNDYVYWACPDMYNKNPSNQYIDHLLANADTPLIDFYNTYKDQYATSGRKVRLGLFETGCRNLNDPQITGGTGQPFTFTSWINTARSVIPASFPQFELFCYWDCWAAQGDWRFTSTQTVGSDGLGDMVQNTNAATNPGIAAYVAMGQDPYFAYPGTGVIERPGHHTGFHKWLAGWCGGAKLQRAYLDGDYTIAPTEGTQSALPYVVTFNVGTRHYYVEYRQPTGFDSHLSSVTGQAANTQGVLINMVDYAGVAAGSLDYAGKPSGRGPWLLDMTPNSAPQTGDADAKDSALLPGDTYTDGAVTVTCSSVSGGSAVVSIAGLPQPPIASTEVTTGGGGLRTTAGRVMPGGLVIPAYPKILAGADDAWGFTTTGGSHVGIETSTMLNRRMAIRRIHYPWGNGPNPNFSWPTSAESGDTTLRNPRVVPCITHGSQGQSATSGFPVKTAGSGNNAYSNTTPYTTGGKTYHGIDIITAGKFDAAYTNSFQRMAALPGPVFFNLWMEMNIPAMGAYGGYQGGVNGPGQASYIAAYRHLHDLSIAAGATNVIWVWAPAQYDPQNNKLTYYPGDDVVDWVMLDLYSHYFNGNVDDIYNFAVAHSKPFGIAEGGFNDTNNTPNVSKAAMVTELQSSISLPKYAETSMYWTWNGVGPDGNHLIDTTSAALTAYQTLYASSNWDATYGGSAVDTQPPTAPTTVTATATGSAAIQIDWSGETDNIGVDHVEIWRSTSSGGTYTNVASDTATPYTDTGRTPATQYFYKLVAVDAANNKSGFSPTANATTQNVASFSVSTSPAVKTPGHYSSAFDAATNPDAGRMWQSFEINGVVYEFGESDHTVDHSTGVAIDRTSTPYVNAYDKVTGAVIQTWAPLPDGVVMDAQITSDGKIALVGGFQNICATSMSGVAILNPLTDPTDTSAASLDSSMPDLQFAGGNVKRITIDVANSRGWVAGAFKTIAGSNVQPVARLKKVSGTWQVDASFTPPSLSATGVYIQGLGAKSDGSSIVVGGQITGGVKKLNGTTGAAQTWNMNWQNTGTQHCISITNDDTYVLCTGDNGEGGGCAILTDWTGAGPNTFTQFGGTGYWYTECDGNIQASALVTLDGVATSVMLGHHGNWCMPNKNQPLNAGTQIRSDGIYALLWGSGTSDPVVFLEPPAMGAASGQGSPLKNWGFYQDPTSGSLYANGDFTTVNGSALYTRAARFDAAGVTDTTPPTAPSGMTATAVSDTEIDLAWTLGTDLNGIAHVQVYRDGAIVTTLIAASSYHDIGLTAQSTHTYHVTNSDPSGNVSTASGDATATTLVGPPPPDSAPLFQTDPTLSDTSPSVGELITVNDAQVQGSPTPALASQVQEAADTPAALIDFLCAYGFGGL